jgi:hypothetical protein
MSFDVDRLYGLLPALYRIRDVDLARRLGLNDDQGPLRSLLAVIAEQVAVLEDDLAQLYDDLFIETCAEWVVPYIGELVSARGLFVFENAGFSQRALVSNTIADRRRKGTAAAIEDIAFDVTGWQVNVVEFFQHLAVSQYMKHLRPQNLMMPHLAKDAASLEYSGTPFDTMARTAEVRRIASRRGRYNIPNVGIFLWRLRDYPASDAPAYQINAQQCLFNAIGRPAVLLTKAQPETEVSHLATPLNVPIPLSRRVLARNLAAYYGPNLSILIKLNGKPVDIANVEACNLSDSGGGLWAQLPGTHFKIDPELGRLLAPASTTPADVIQITYRYGFSAEMAGGEYERAATFTPGLSVPVVVTGAAPVQPALDSLGGAGVVEIADNDYHVAPASIAVAGSHAVELRAANQKRPVLLLAGDLLVTGAPESDVALNGLIIAGGAVRVPALDSSGQPNGLRTLRLRHCTLMPGDTPPFLLPGGGFMPPTKNAPRLIVEAAGLTIEIENCIIGTILAADVAALSISNSLIDASDETGLAYGGLSSDEPGAPLETENTTVVGKVNAQSIKASNTIFLSAPAPGDTIEPVRAERLQEGCIRFSFVPPGSRVPRRYRCQPESVDDAARVRPVFTSLNYADAGYGQLDGHCAAEITQGADDQSEMGAFHNLHQPQRISNLQTRVEEYLRFGLEAGIFLES